MDVHDFLPSHSTTSNKVVQTRFKRDVLLFPPLFPFFCRSVLQDFFPKGFLQFLFPLRWEFPVLVSRAGSLFPLNSPSHVFRKLFFTNPVSERKLDQRDVPPFSLIKNYLLNGLRTSDLRSRSSCINMGPPPHGKISLLLGPSFLPRQPFSSLIFFLPIFSFPQR